MYIIYLNILICGHLINPWLWYRYRVIIAIKTILLKLILFNSTSIFYCILNKYSTTDFNGLEIVLVKIWSISHLVETSIGEIGKGIFTVEMGIG